MVILGAFVGGCVAAPVAIIAIIWWACKDEKITS